MAWIHIPSIPSTFSPDTVGFNLGFDSPESPSGPSATSSGTSTASKSFASVKSMDFSMTLPSGMTSSHSTGDPGVDEWISCQLASPANPTQTPDSARGPVMTGTSGPIRSESSGKWDQESSSWRTSQASLWDLIDGHHMGALWSESWPTQGMTRNGELYPLRPQADRTSANGGGSWHIPAPTSADVYTGNLESSQQSDDSMYSVSLPDFVHRWPTPDSSPRGARASDLVADNGRSVARRTSGQQRGIDLQTSVKMFPTPRAGKTSDEDEESWLARHAAGKVATPPLALAMRMLPTPSSGGSWTTPQSQDAKHSGHGASDRTSEIAAKHTMQQIRNRVNQSGYHSNLEELVALETPAQGSLSPDWVSWLMGLPLKWTSLEPLPREEYLDWLHSQMDGTWWQEERGLPRVATGIKDRINRLKCLGNGIVPASLALFLRGTR